MEQGETAQWSQLTHIDQDDLSRRAVVWRAGGMGESGAYLLGEVVVLVRGHARGHVEDHLGGGGGEVGRGHARAVVPLQAAHEAAVTGQVHLETRQSLTSPSPPHH